MAGAAIGGILLFRIVLPITLLAATIVRFNGLSFMYGVLLLVAPLVPTPSLQALYRKRRAIQFLIASVVLCSLAFVGQIAFQVAILVKDLQNTSNTTTLLTNCSFEESLLRQLGFQRVVRDDGANILRVVLPDLGACLLSAITLGVCIKLWAAPAPPPSTEEEEDRQPLQEAPVKLRMQKQPSMAANHLAYFLVVVFLGLAGITHPSVLSAAYFLVFLITATYWACGGVVGSRFNVVRILLLLYSGGHLLLLYLYQFQFFQEAISPASLEARLIGLTGLVRTDCSQPWYLLFHETARWPMYASPGVILVLYHILAFEVRMWCDREATEELQASPSLWSKWRQPTVDTERQYLVDPSTSQPNYQATATSDAEAATADASNAEQADKDAKAAAEPRQEVPEAETDEPVKRGVASSVFRFFMRQSYVLALIIMMVWSITYHSWLALVFLLMACLIWITPKCRSLCLKLSPLILFYAIGLLIAGYVYSLDLTDSELPVNTTGGYSFSEIGLVKYTYPVGPLAAKIAFTIAFWLLLYQFLRERAVVRHEEGVGISMTLLPQSPTRNHILREDITLLDGLTTYDSESVKAFGAWARLTLSKYWILVVVAMFLVVALQEAVIYRIIYMGLFIYFLLSFQVWYKCWRVSLSVFWWITIIYSMVVLLLIYTYQFSIVYDQWRRIPGITEDLLQDIGLQMFSTAELFVKLLTPTFFLIVVIIQLHYFQRDFLLLTDVNRFRLVDLTNPGNKDEENAEGAGEGQAGHEQQGEGQAGEEQQGDDQPEEEDTTEEALKRTMEEDWKHYSKLFLKKLNQGLKVVEVIVWRLLEIHIFKLVAFTIIISCLTEVTAINVVFLVLMMIAVPIPQLQGCISHLAQAWAGLVILARMTYQLRLIRTDYWLSNCTDMNYSIASTTPATIVNTTSATAYNLSILPVAAAGMFEEGNNYPFNQTIDNAKYVGLVKVGNIGWYVRCYIAIALMLAFQAVIQVHQKQYYNKPGVVTPKMGILFPEVTRKEADIDLIHCAKYFANYTFYKFGLEICLILLVVTICVRLDAFAIIYCLLLFLLLLLSRRGCLIFWPFFVLLLAILLTIQYLSVLGAPPGLCWPYPWDKWDGSQPPTYNDFNLKKWLYLPSYTVPPFSYKLLADFFLLLFASLQWRVFYLENSSEMEAYGGGPNKDITDEIINHAENPVPDFTSCKDSYLEYVKSWIFQYMIWVTLIIIFLTGTSRISLFCMGYLIGCFVLLWMGQEMLIKPFLSLMRMWRILLWYNFFVIICKAVLQLIGCVYIKRLVPDNCWVVQLLSIACLKSGSFIIPEEDPGCEIPADQAGLAWDAVAFVFLLFQLRVFRTHYFRHVVMELLAQNSLASRGAQLTNERLVQRVAEQRAKEDEVLQKIKNKMERIKQRQAKVQSKAIQDVDDHFIVIRSGDYYMFEDDEDEDDVTKELTSMDISSVDKEERGEKSDAIDILNKALTEGATEGALKAAESSDDQKKGKKVHYKTEEEKEEEEKKASVWSKIKSILVIIWGVIAGILDEIIDSLNDVSQDYREVYKILEEEKKVEKERGQRELQKLNEERRKEKRLKEKMKKQPTSDAPGIEEPPRETEGVIVEVEPPAEQQPKSDGEGAGQDAPHGCDEEEKFTKSTPRLFQLLVALYDALIARSEVMCYFAMILNVLVSASLLALPYPFSVFLWAMLSVPRPTKTYWITIITYTEAVVIVKYLFQFGFFPWNKENSWLYSDSPFWPPRFIGIEQKDRYAVFDLILLFTLFIHRSVLKRHGLWKDYEEAKADFDKEKEKAGSAPSSPTSSRPALEDKSSGKGERDQTASTSSDDQDQPEKRSKVKSFCSWMASPLLNFYKQMTNPDYNAVTDVYSLMFFCDLICFLILVFGYQGFGPKQTVESADVTKVFAENRVPIPFLFMLLAMFILIIVDRALYLRKAIFGRFIFQIFLVILVHIWMFFILPAVTGRKFTNNVPAQLWYFFKCIYFGLAAYQIRSGYPVRILGNFLTKKYNYTNLFLYKGFLAIPFLLELRALMDWIWTDTTLAIGAWMQVEDIYANIFVLKCWREAERKYPTQRGIKKKAVIKYGVGGLLLFVLLFIIWFPLVLFSLANTVYVNNPPYDCTMEIAIGGYQPIFRTSAQQQFLHPLTESEYNTLQHDFPGSSAFFSNYKTEDVILAEINGQSTSIWGISPPSEEAMLRDLRRNDTKITFYVTVTFSRSSRPGISTETVTNQFTKELNDTAERGRLADIIANGTQEAGTVTMSEVFPRFMRVPASGQPVGVSSLTEVTGFSNITLSVNSDKTGEKWWTLKELVSGKVYDWNEEKPKPKDSLYVISFNDRVAPAALSFFSGYGIIGLYISLVLVIGRFVRMFFSGMSYRIMFEELPNVDKILSLLLSIYLVRESKEFKAEEYLFSKLIFLYRSPETMIKLTKHKFD